MYCITRGTLESLKGEHMYQQQFEIFIIIRDVPTTYAEVQLQTGNLPVDHEETFTYLEN